ncbi:hypothetical protein [Actinokineospora sp.]|uniref:hypothetical protein n=1 Tax=Actinokineospora sp. TaxID=1872133 RepID=UPI003D6B2032
MVAIRTDALRGHPDAVLLATLDGRRPHGYGLDALAAKRAAWREFISTIATVLEPVT